MKGFIIYPTYKIEGNKAFVYLFGRLENGESFCTIHHFRPYFFIRAQDKEKAQSLKTNDELDHILSQLEYQDTDFKDFDGNAMVKVVQNIPKNVPIIKRLFHDHAIPCFEADIRFAMRFLIDHDLKGSVDIEGEYESGETVDRIYKEPEIRPAIWVPELKILSIDIETDRKGKDLWSISMIQDTFAKVLIVKDKSVKLEKAENFEDVPSLLQRFKEIILKLDPDVLVGWNFIDFDLKILRELFKQHNIPFRFGRIDWDCTLRISESFFIGSSADVPGRMVLDGIALLKDAMISLPNYKLNTAAKHFLGQEKIFTASDRWDQIE